MTERAYFDWNATAPLREEARAAMLDALARTGNASSVHGEGRATRALVENARAQVAMLVGVAPRQVIFTSGGTEANNLALTPAIEAGANKQPRGKLFVSAIEHPSVRAGGRFSAVEELPVTGDGRIDLEQLGQRLARSGHALVSLMLANNETGVLQPVREAADVAHRAGALLHVDAVQGPGRIGVNFEALGADLMTLSAHKIGGPQGAGALIRRDDIHISDQLLRGGGQERGQRAGTENVAAIVGFGAAAAAVTSALSSQSLRLSQLRSALEGGLRGLTADVVIFGEHVPRLPNTTLFALPGVKAETAVIAFDLEGIAVSSGAACSSGKVAPSHVLEAMGIPAELARGAIRASFGHTTADRDVGMILKAWEKLSKSLYKAGNHREIAA